LAIPASSELLDLRLAASTIVDTRHTDESDEE